MNPTDSPSGPARRQRARIGRVIIRVVIAACVIAAAAQALVHHGSVFFVAPAIGIVSGLCYLWVTRGRQ